MPTYEFRCSNGHDFEHFHPRISDAPSTIDCPQCGVAAERRISGGAGLVFKGSGFYLTDYGKNAHRTGGSSAKPDAGSSSSSGESGAKSDAGGKSEGGAKADASGGASSGGSTSSAPSTPTPKSE